MDLKTGAFIDVIYRLTLTTKAKEREFENLVLLSRSRFDAPATQPPFLSGILPAAAGNRGSQRATPLPHPLRRYGFLRQPRSPHQTGQRWLLHRNQEPHLVAPGRRTQGSVDWRTATSSGNQQRGAPALGVRGNGRGRNDRGRKTEDGVPQQSVGAQNTGDRSFPIGRRSISLPLPRCRSLLDDLANLVAGDALFGYQHLGDAM